MRGVRAVLSRLLAALALPGCMPTAAPVTTAYAAEPMPVAAGFSPRARRDHVTLTHTDSSGSTRVIVPLGTSLSPGDTILVGERWF